MKRGVVWRRTRCAELLPRALENPAALAALVIGFLREPTGTPGRLVVPPAHLGFVAGWVLHRSAAPRVGHELADPLGHPGGLSAAATATEVAAADRDLVFA
jgi:hypothetical protein